MTKKVLISLDEWEAIAGGILIGLPFFSPEICCFINNTFRTWFDAQKDIYEILDESKKDFLASAGIK